MNKGVNVAVYGEVMQKFSPSTTGKRMSQADLIVREPAGAEFNVASALSRTAHFSTSIISAIPDNMDGDWIEEKILKEGINIDYLKRDTSPDARLGNYEFEEGIYPRSSKINYDRNNSSFTKFNHCDYNVDFTKFSLFHTTGISLAINPMTTLGLIRAAHDKGCLVSFDVNYRANLWNKNTAAERIERILPYVDILFISRETLQRTFSCADTSLKGFLVCWAKTHHISFIASTDRTCVDASTQKFTSSVMERETFQTYTEAPYIITDLRGRIGSGDAYIAGFLMGLLKNNNLSAKKAMEFGNAATALKCSCIGDILIASEQELLEVINKHNSTVKSEFENLKR